MELRQLQYFAVLAKELNFSRAARELCITQGTLSQQIRQLEAEIGANLFERTSHSVTLTESGLSLMPYAQKTLEAAFDCSQVATDLNNMVAGSLNIGITHSFKYLLRNTLKEFIKRYPKIRIKVYYSTASSLLAMLRERKIDFFIAFKPSAQFHDIESVDLFDSRLAVIMRRDHVLAGKKSLGIDELRKYPIALPSGELQSRKAFEHSINIDASRLNVAMETNDPNILLEVLSSTNLIAIASSLAISYRDDLTWVPLEVSDSVLTGCIHRLKNTYVKRSARTFMQMMVESAELEKIARLEF